MLFTIERGWSIGISMNCPFELYILALLTPIEEESEESDRIGDVHIFKVVKKGDFFTF